MEDSEGNESGPTVNQGGREKRGAQWGGFFLQQRGRGKIEEERSLFQTLPKAGGRKQLPLIFKKGTEESVHGRG